MAARNDLEVAVTDGKTVGIAENLAVAAVARGKIYRGFVFPVVVVQTRHGVSAGHDE